MSRTEPAPQITIRDLAALRVATHPLRQQILATLNGPPRTVREVAEELGRDPHTLYYHVHVLEEHGLIRVAHSRMVSGILEKHYQVVAYEFLVESDLVSPGAAGADPLLDEILQLTLRRTESQVREMVRRGVIDLGLRAPEPRALLSRANFARLTPERARELTTRLLDLIAEFSRDVSDDPERERGYWFAATFHPCDLDDEAEASQGA
jgi:DNA-binding transcriptional ArsR family regulator